MGTSFERKDFLDRLDVRYDMSLTKRPQVTMSGYLFMLFIFLYFYETKTKSINYKTQKKKKKMIIKNTSQYAPDLGPPK